MHPFLKLAACCAWFVASLAQAESGVSSNEILIGRSGAYSGFAASIGKELITGAKLYFDKVNAAGGVNGRKIKLIELDDQTNPEQAKANTQQLIDQEKIMALFLYQGTPVVAAVEPLVEQRGIPFIAPNSGADVFRDAAKFPHTFHVRASYGTELRTTIRQLHTIGIDRIAVAYQNDGFGKSILATVDGILKEQGGKVLVSVPMQQAGDDAESAAAAMVQAKPQAIILASLGNALVKFVQAYRKGGNSETIYSLSLLGQAQIEQLGKNSYGLAVTQVFPSPNDDTIRVVQEMQQALKKQMPGEKSSYLKLEGFVAAKVLVEGLKRAGKDLSRERLYAELEKLGNFDVGGMTVSYSPTRHNGSSFVELTMINREGRFLK